MPYYMIQIQKFQKQTYITKKNNKKKMKCHYCRKQSIGINYKPRPQLDNIPVCQQHKSSLFIPFHDTYNIEKASFMEFHTEMESQRGRDNCRVRRNKREIQNQEFFQEFMEVVVGEFNLVKAEVRGCEDRMKKLDKENVYGFDIGCKITNPYMLLRQDKDMMLNTLLTRIKKSFDSKKRSQKNPQHSQKSSEYTHTRQSTDIKGILSPKMKNSFITVADSYGNNRSSIASPSHFSFGVDGDGIVEREKYFRKSEKCDQ